MYKVIMTVAALAAFAFCAPASASAQQDICTADTPPHGYTARDVQEMCADRKAASRDADDEDDRPTKTATNVPPGAIIDATHRLMQGLNQQQQRRPPQHRGQYRDEVDEEGDAVMAGNRSRGSRGAGRCPAGFHPSEGACIRSVSVSGGNPKYDVPREKAHCQIGTTRSFWTTSPEGYKRKVDQTCR